MSRPANTAGPYTFTYTRQSMSRTERIGTKPTKCDVPECPKPAPWNGTALGWNIGTYCGPHKEEMLRTARGILQPNPGAVAA